MHTTFHLHSQKLCVYIKSRFFHPGVFVNPFEDDHFGVSPRFWFQKTRAPAIVQHFCTICLLVAVMIELQLVTDRWTQGHSKYCVSLCCAVKCQLASFLADRTIGRAFGTLCCLSSSVTFCIVAKRYVLAKNCLKE